MDMKQTEAQLQTACINWFKLTYPNLKQLIWHTPNGGYRNGREGAKMKRMGVLAGVPDVFIAIPNGNYGGMFVEMKRGRNGLTDLQKEQCEKLREAGYYVTVCKGTGEFMDEVADYFELNINQK